MRLIVLLGLFALLLSKILPCQAAQVITPYSIESTTACLPVFLENATAAQEVCITEHESTILILVYDHNEVIAGLIRPKTGVYSYYKAHLRDGTHEELIGISTSGPRHKLTDLFIMGLDAADNEIYPLPLITEYKRPCFLSTKLELDYGTLLIPLQRTCGLKIAIRWDPVRQIFIASNYNALSDDSQKD